LGIDQDDDHHILAQVGRCAKSALSQFNGAVANHCRISLLSIEALFHKLRHFGVLNRLTRKYCSQNLTLTR